MIGPRNKKFCTSTCKTGFNHTKQRAEIKQELVRMKGGKCIYCGYDKDVVALDFHHTDPMNKSNDISTIMRKYGKATALRLCQAEIAKCILLCANCHREQHGA